MHITFYWSRRVYICVQGNFIQYFVFTLHGDLLVEDGITGLEKDGTVWWNFITRIGDI